MSGHSLELALASRSFRYIGLAVFLGSICSQTLHVHQAAFLVDHGLSAMTAASVISVVGASSIVGKTGGGFVSDFFSRELVYALGMIGMIVGVGVLWLVALAPSAWLALAGFLLIGFGASNIVPVLFTAAGSQKDMPASLAVSAISTIGYAGILAGPGLIGFVAHAVGLQWAFAALACGMLLVATQARRTA